MQLYLYGSHATIDPTNTTPGNVPYCRIIAAFRDVYHGWQGETVLKTFGTMGFRHFDLTPRDELLNTWNALRGL